MSIIECSSEIEAGWWFHPRLYGSRPGRHNGYRAPVTDDPYRDVDLVVLYDGDIAVPFGDRLWAAPFGVLFGSSEKPR